MNALSAPHERRQKQHEQLQKCQQSKEPLLAIDAQWPRKLPKLVVQWLKDQPERWKEWLMVRERQQGQRRAQAQELFYHKWSEERIKADPKNTILLAQQDEATEHWRAWVQQLNKEIKKANGRRVWLGVQKMHLTVPEPLFEALLEHGDDLDQVTQDLLQLANNEDWHPLDFWAQEEHIAWFEQAKNQWGRYHDCQEMLTDQIFLEWVGTHPMTFWLLQETGTTNIQPNGKRSPIYRLAAAVWAPSEFSETIDKQAIKGWMTSVSPKELLRMLNHPELPKQAQIISEVWKLNVLDYPELAEPQPVAAPTPKWEGNVVAFARKPKQ